MVYLITQKLDNGYKVHTLGSDFNVTKEEVETAVKNGQAYFKANKPVENMAQLDRVLTKA